MNSFNNAHDNDFCWAALAVSILSSRPKRPEEAFELLERRQPSSAQIEAETQIMIGLAEDGFSYREIGELFGGLTRGAVHKRISRSKKKVAGIGQCYKPSK